MEWGPYVVDGLLRVRVKPNASETTLLGYDEQRHAILIAVAAAPEDNKANLALLKFLKKQLGKPVRLKSGATSRDKIIEIIE